jgi:AraC-like DNA-binding protein
MSMSDRIEIIVRFLHTPAEAYEEQPIDKALNEILTSGGRTTISTLRDITGVSDRHLERLFKKSVGLSPKFFARVVRFNTIFKLAREDKPNVLDLGLESGFYDQSHFIRNFKAFTGEEPSRYFFFEPTLANFFLNRKNED